MVVAAMPLTALIGTGMRAVVISVIVHPRGPIDVRGTRYKSIDRLSLCSSDRGTVLRASIALAGLSVGGVPRTMSGTLPAIGCDNLSGCANSGG